jgi:hypothetical protein
MPPEAAIDRTKTSNQAIATICGRRRRIEWRARRAYEVAAMGISNPEELPPLVAAQVATLGPIYGQVLLEVYGKKMITLDASVLE